VGLLSSLLASAADTRPGEVVIETDQPVKLVHAQGAATLGEALTGDAVFDALAEVLSSEQQADLALGEPVKFDLVVGGTTWHLVGETAQEVTAVRARPSDGAFDPADSVPIPIETDDPLENVPRLRRRSGSMPPAGQPDIDIEIHYDDDTVEERAGVRLAALRPVTVEAEPRSRWPRQVSALASANRAESPRRRPPGGPPRGSTAARRSDLDVVALAMPAGTLGFLHRAPGQGAALARALQWPAFRIGEGTSFAQALAGSDGLPDGGALLVDLEDPSPWLAWLLRRVEEGRRVLVETRATTPAGARRILLGVAATPRAEEWLDAVRVVHATLVSGEWTLLNPET
jgi:hypothetical protein